MKTKKLNFRVSKFNESMRKVGGWLKRTSIQVLLIAIVVSNSKTIYAQTQQWIQVGPDLATANPDYEVMKFDEEGNAFFAYSDQSASTSLNVKKFDGISWSSVGPVNITTGAIIYEKDIAFDTLGVPHVAFVNGLNQITVIKFNGTDWDTLGNANFASTDGLNHRIAFEVDRITNNPIVAYRDLTSTKLCVEQYDGTAWNFYNNGQDISSGSASLIDMVVDDSYSCFIGYADGAINDSLTILRTHSALTNWVPSSTIEPVSSNGPISALRLGTDGSYPVVIYINSVDSKVYTHRYQGAGIWYECPTEIGTADFYEDLAIKRHDGGTYVGFADTYELYKPTTKRLDDLDYYDVVEDVDLAGFESETPRNMTFGSDQDGNLFVAFGDLTVRVYKLTTVSQAGISENDSITLVVYPNPATDFIFLNLNSASENQKVELFAVDGRLISTVEMTEYNGMISVDHLAPGTYVVRVTNDQTQITKQFILK